MHLQMPHPTDFTTKLKLPHQSNDNELFRTGHEINNYMIHKGRVEQGIVHQAFIRIDKSKNNSRLIRVLAAD